LIGKNDEVKNQDDVVVEIETTYELFFTSSEEINEDFLSVYEDVSLSTNIWPYFRELAQNLTSRSGIRPVIIPLSVGIGRPLK
jgi:preprotein translocase subunit SecB